MKTVKLMVIVRCHLRIQIGLFLSKAKTIIVLIMKSQGTILSMANTHIKKCLHHLGSTSSGTFTYKWIRDPHKQHFSSFYCSWKPHIAWCTIIQIDFQKLRSRLQYTPVPLIPSNMSSCIDAYLYPLWHSIHKFIKTLLA